MADRLDNLLEPGERVLHRAQGAWIPSVVFGIWSLLHLLISVGVSLVCTGAYLVISAIGSSAPEVREMLAYEELQALFHEGLRGLALLTVPAAIFSGLTWHLYRTFRAEALVTDRRLLYRLAKRQAEIAEMPLDEIVAIQ